MINEKERAGDYHIKPSCLHTKHWKRWTSQKNLFVLFFNLKGRTLQQTVNCNIQFNFTNSLYSKSHQNISELLYKLRLTFQTTSCMYLFIFIHYNILLEIGSDILTSDRTHNILHEPNLSAKRLYVVCGLLQQAGQFHGLATGHQPAEDISLAWLP